MRYELRPRDCREAGFVPDDDAPEITQIGQHIRAFGFYPNYRLLLPGDFLLFQSDHANWISRRIVALQDDLGFGPSDAKWTHVAIYAGDRFICDAAPGGVRHRSLDSYVGTHTLRVRRVPNLPVEDRFRLVIAAMTRLGDKYSYFLGWKLLREYRRSLSKKLRYSLPGNRGVICSQLAAEAFLYTTRTALSTDTSLYSPAHISASGRLDEVRIGWLRLPAP